jgi:hypothetical protein
MIQPPLCRNRLNGSEKFSCDSSIPAATKTMSEQLVDCGSCGGTDSRALRKTTRFDRFADRLADSEAFVGEHQFFCKMETKDGDDSW